jgi:FkbM family methyltransferase
VDAIAAFLRGTSDFRGKGRLLEYWLRTRTGNRIRIVGGHRLTLDMTVPYEAMVWLEWEEQRELDVLVGLLRPGELFVDCGANIGLWSLVAAASGAEVVAFEANPYTAKRLAENVAHASVRVVPAAVSDRAGQALLDLGEWHNLSRLAPEGTIPVPMTTIDSELDRPPAGMKLDIEGGEMAALRGAQETLKHRPWIAVEFNTEHTVSRRIGDWDVYRYLAVRGYTAYAFTGERLSETWEPRWGYANVLCRTDN